jgi:hypothetical protein
VYLLQEKKKLSFAQRNNMLGIADGNRDGRPCAIFPA